MKKTSILNDKYHYINSFILTLKFFFAEWIDYAQECDATNASIRFFCRVTKQKSQYLPAVYYNDKNIFN